MIGELPRLLDARLSDRTPLPWRWHNRRVLLVDGTTVTMPDTAENQAVFPQSGSQPSGLGFPICRIVGIPCLTSGALLNAGIGRYSGKGSSEQALLRDTLDTLAPGDRLLGDAFFSTWFFIAEMQFRGVDILMEP